MATRANTYDYSLHPKAVHETDAPDGVAFSFGAIVDNDSPGKSFGFRQDILDAEALDMDQWETFLAKAKKRSKKKSMDLALGIGCFDYIGNSYSHHRLLLVELKLNLDPYTFNPKISELIEKLESSKAILSGRPLDTLQITLVPSSCYSEAVHKFNSRKRGSGAAKLRSWEIKTPEMFNNLIPDNNNCPYQPVNEKKEIDKSLAPNPSAEDLYRFLDYWNKEAQRFVSNDANYYEARHILNCVKERASLEIARIGDKDSVDLQIVGMLLDDTDSLIQKYNR